MEVHASPTNEIGVIVADTKRYSYLECQKPCESWVHDDELRWQIDDAKYNRAVAYVPNENKAKLITVMLNLFNKITDGMDT